MVSRFNKYIFDSQPRERTDGLNNNGAKFLQQVVDLFEDNIRAVGWIMDFSLEKPTK